MGWVHKPTKLKVTSDSSQLGIRPLCYNAKYYCKYIAADLTENLEDGYTATRHK